MDRSLHTCDVSDAVQTLTARVDAYVSKKIEMFDAARARQTEYLAQAKERISELQKQLNSLRERTEREDESLRSDQAELWRLSNEVAALRAERDPLPARIQDLEAQLAQHHEDISVRSQRLSLAEEGLQQDLARVDTVYELYARTLGLTFENPADDAFRVSFTRVDPHDEEREFSFTVQLVGDRYELIACDPPIDRGEELVSMCNHSNNFSKLVCGFRREFSALCRE
eukprot:gnl/Chilomastix_cuspidata/3732.p1 GENE.gnl/Chilomastix_cuspidata/3732~~gnl/Chilomastix_cuspidata/3732.p1  ORF type:complete len:227 (+),score=60.49 gnl/Chilomastix_cuspidata/3732:215-895(+)